MKLTQGSAPGKLAQPEPMVCTEPKAPASESGRYKGKRRIGMMKQEEE